MKITPCGIGTPAHERVFALVRQAALDFERLGVEHITIACNAERVRLLELARTNGSVTHQGSIFDSELVVTQLGDPFRLQPLPEQLFVDFSQTVSPRPKFKDTPMTTDGPCIRVHMTHIWPDRAWCPTINTSVEDTVLHELLHVCGEWEHDGTIRYNWSGAAVIRAMLNDPNTR